MPARRDGLGPFYRDVIAVDPLEPYEVPSAVYRLEVVAALLRALVLPPSSALGLIPLAGQLPFVEPRRGPGTHRRR